MNRFCLFALAVAAPFLFSGCLTESLNPLSPPEKAQTDPQLEGSWHMKMEKTELFLYFVKQEPSRLIAVYVEVEEGKPNASAYTLFTTTIGEDRFMNLQSKPLQGENAKEGGTPKYFFARYTVSKSGELTMWITDKDAIAKAIKTGKIKGEVKSQGLRQSVAITDTTENLAAFVKGANLDELFKGRFGTSFQKLLPKTP